MRCASERDTGRAVSHPGRGEVGGLCSDGHRGHVERTVTVIGGAGVAGISRTAQSEVRREGPLRYHRAALVRRDVFDTHA